MKVCIRCGVPKDSEKGYYNQAKGKDGKDNVCIACRRKHVEANKERIAAIKYKSSQKNLAKILARNKEYNERTGYMGKYVEKNKAIIQATKKKSYENNKTEAIKRAGIWNKANPEKRRIMKNANRKARKVVDPLYKLTENIRGAFGRSLSRHSIPKSSRTHEVIGCDYGHLLAHLNTNNYGFVFGDPGLNIDHVVPLSTATTEQELLSLWHYTNLQLLPAIYNQHIKADKRFDIEHFEMWLQQIAA